MNKKNKIIIGSITTCVILGGSIAGFMLHNNKNNEVPIITNNTINEKKIEVLSNLELELGSEKPVFASFVKDEKINGTIEILLDDKVIEEETLNKVGDYTVNIKIDDKNYTSVIHVVDKIAPVLKLKEVKIVEGNKYKINDFVKSCTDNSYNDCTLNFVKDEMSKYTKVGTYDIEISAKDNSDNETKEKTKLTIEKKQENTNKENNSNSINKDKNTNNSNENNNNIKENENNTNKNENKENNTNENTQNNNQTNTNTNTNENNSNETNKETAKNPTTELLPEAKKLASMYASEINEVVRYTNELRSEVGLAPLTLNTTLTQAAMVRALEESEANLFNHTRPNGSKWSTVLKEINYGPTTLGENLAGGQRSAQMAVEEWRNSQGHYANIINAKFTKIGVGLVKGGQYNYYWVQLFSN